MSETDYCGSVAIVIAGARVRCADRVPENHTAPCAIKRAEMVADTARRFSVSYSAIKTLRVAPTGDQMAKHLTNAATT